jgi:hypothetical protein
MVQPACHFRSGYEIAGKGDETIRRGQSAILSYALDAKGCSALRRTRRGHRSRRTSFDWRTRQRRQSRDRLQQMQWAKNNAAKIKWDKRPKHKPIKGKYGPPLYWDGFSTLFVILAQRDSVGLAASDKAWLKELTRDG